MDLTAPAFAMFSGQVEASMTRDQELLQAVGDGDTAAIRDLKRMVRDVQDSERRSLLLVAVEARQAEALDVLLRLWEEQDPEDDEDDDGEAGAALCLAVELGAVECAQVLLAHGVCVDHAFSADGIQQTPLHIAAMYNVTKNGLHELLLDNAMSLDPRDLCENTPLHVAAAYGSYEVAHGLLKAGADVNAVNASGATPLHLACPSGYDKIVQLLVAHGANVNAQDSLGNTPLIDAAFVRQSFGMEHYAYGDAESQNNVISLLLQSGAEVDARNREQEPAIAGAVRNGYVAAVASLLRSGASVNTKNRRHESVLHIAARAGVESIEVWKMLLLAGADVLARDRYERTCYEIWVSRPKTVRDARPEDEPDADDSVLDEDDVVLLLEAALLMVA